MEAAEKRRADEVQRRVAQQAGSEAALGRGGGAGEKGVVLVRVDGTEPNEQHDLAPGLTRK